MFHTIFHLLITANSILISKTNSQLFPDVNIRSRNLIKKWTDQNILKLQHVQNEKSQQAFEEEQIDLKHASLLLLNNTDIENLNNEFERHTRDYHMNENDDGSSSSNEPFPVEIILKARINEFENNRDKYSNNVCYENFCHGKTYSCQTDYEALNRAREENPRNMELDRFFRDQNRNKMAEIRRNSDVENFTPRPSFQIRTADSLLNKNFIICLACTGHTEGVHCELCRSNYYNIFNLDKSGTYNNQVFCEHCKCNKLGSKSQKCNGKSGQCVCRRGYESQKCERCVADYHNPSKLELSRKKFKRIKSVHNITDAQLENRLCIRNVCNVNDMKNVTAVCQQVDKKAICENGACVCMTKVASHFKYYGKYCNKTLMSSGRSLRFTKILAVFGIIIVMVTF